jgi:hypothetical protein
MTPRLGRPTPHSTRLPRSATLDAAVPRPHALAVTEPTGAPALGVGPYADDDRCEIRCVDQAKVARVRALAAPAATLATFAETFKALGDPTRLRLLTALALEELCVCDLATLVDVSESAVSHSLRTLCHHQCEIAQKYQEELLTWELSCGALRGPRADATLVSSRWGGDWCTAGIPSCYYSTCWSRAWENGPLPSS